ncbi:AlbA family DNA-binding domain-containing protein [Asticcacaulis sp.]|uniref:AlbA family DNA-binding domain-containing protein n=1 Tax=Asticcacaulis sp. TaxID=1872648 RepID=UPI003F7CB076
MIPTKLDDWSYENIKYLCTAGSSESDRHDFKFNLPDTKNLTKICCAFANTFGGFIIVGIKDSGHANFEIIGIDADKELYGKFNAKLKASPDITVPRPKIIAAPNSEKLLYVFEIPVSLRRPHLPTPQDERIFWKRQGADCTQMTLEECQATNE